MPYHVVIDGEKRGPYPSFRVIELLRDGEVSPDALGWEPGMEAWIKLRDLPAFTEAIDRIENPPEPEESEEGEGKGKGSEITTSTAKAGDENRSSGTATAMTSSDSSDSEAAALTPMGTRPISRFLARLFDYMLVSTVAVFFVDVPTSPFADGATPTIGEILKYFQDPAYQHMAQVQSLAIVGWHLIEGILLHLFGTTPGKAAFGIRIVDSEGRYPGLGKGLTRAFMVWLLGFGLGLPILNLLAMIAGLFVLLMTRATLWDRQLGLQVRIPPLTPGRILVVTGAVLLLLMLTTIASLKFS